MLKEEKNRSIGYSVKLSVTIDADRRVYLLKLSLFSVSILWCINKNQFIIILITHLIKFFIYPLPHFIYYTMINTRIAVWNKFSTIQLYKCSNYSEPDL